MGRLHTCYSPVRRSPASKASFAPAAPRLACVRPVASVHPEPGSNSPLLFIFLFFFFRFSALRKISTKLSGIFRSSTQQRPNLSLFTFRFTRNHDVDSVVISFPCLSLFPCLSQSFQWPLSFLSANYSKQIRDLYHHPLIFFVCGCKGTTKNPFNPNFFQTFFQVFSPPLRNLPSLSTLHPQKIYALKHIFPTTSPTIHPPNLNFRPSKKQ